MSSMKKLGLITALAAMCMGTSSSKSYVDPSEIDTTPATPPIPKGLKMFEIDGMQVWAINEKNAIRKAKKMKP